MGIKYNGSNSLTYLLTLLNTKFGTKVDKVEGKGLSTNDLTNALKTQYDAAEKNTIVTIQKNSTDLTPDSNRKVNITVPTKTSDITNDSGFITLSQVPPGAVASTTTPKMDGTAAVGTELAFARGDHVHPSDTTKVDKVSGKGLSTNDYTTAEQTKLSGITAEATKVESSTTNGNIKINGTEATVYTHPGSGTNPHGTTKSDVGLSNVGNFKAVSTAASQGLSETEKTNAKTNIGLNNVGNFKAVSTVASQGLTDTEKSNARANIGAGTSSFSGNYNDLTNKPTIPTVPAISTNITSDATSDTKTASPKAVKTYVDSKVASTYKPAGSVAFANLPTLSSSVLGNVYNLTDAFTTTANFVEGAGKTYPAGTNVVVVDTGSSVYKFDVLAGFIDLSPYLKSADAVELTNTEVQTIWDSVFTS